MTVIEKQITVAAPPDVSAAYVAAAWEDQMAFWSGVSGWQPLSPPPFGDGFRVRYRALTPGIKTIVETEIQDYRPGEGWRVVAVSGANLQAQWRFTPSAEGTVIAYRMEFYLPYGFLGRIVARFVATPKWHFLIRRSLRHLKKALEAEVAGANPALSG